MLYIIRHRGALDIEFDYIASHPERPLSVWDQQWATLVDASEPMAWKLATLDNVIRVEIARPGRFGGYTDGAVIVRHDGTWIEEDEVGPLD